MLFYYIDNSIFRRFTTNSDHKTQTINRVEEEEEEEEKEKENHCANVRKSTLRKRKSMYIFQKKNKELNRLF